MIFFSDLKEHVAITIFASTAADSALAINIFAADDLFYGIQVLLYFIVVILRLIWLLVAKRWRWYLYTDR
jgi:hypothetical protein